MADMPLLRSKLYDGEDVYFKANPHVTGMAAEDGHVILNPYSSLNDDQKGAVYLNEASRLHMRSNGTPSFNLTDEQAKFLNSNTYKDASDEDRRATVLARIISGDSSVGTPTDEQVMEAESVKRAMDKAEYSNAWKEQTE